MQRRINILTWAVFLLYIAAVMFLCLYRFSASPIDLGKYFLGIRMDRFAHLLMFLPYPFTAWLIFRYSVPSEFVRKHALAAAFITGILFAAFSELMQHLLSEYRQGDIADFLADSVSVLAGVIILWASGAGRTKKTGKHPYGNE